MTAFTPIPSTFPRVTLAAADAITAFTIANASAGTVYYASLQATRIL